MDTIFDNGEIKQIITVTDGRPDSGISSVDAARKAYDAGIVISAIGIIGLEGGSENSVQKAENIAKSGGGLWEYSHMEDFCGTLRNLTYKTTRKTIEHTVERQLKHILGGNIETLDSEARSRIADFIDSYGENINQKCIIVFDINKSMTSKPAVLKKGIIEMSERLNKRKGRSSIAVISGITCDFTGDIGILKQNLKKMNFGENTPLGYLIFKACEMMHRYYEVYDYNISRQ